MWFHRLSIPPRSFPEIKKITYLIFFFHLVLPQNVSETFLQLIGVPEDQGTTVTDSGLGPF